MPWNWNLAALWILLYLTILAPTLHVVSKRIPRHLTVYWNATNPIFDSNNSDHIMNVNFGDTIDIICPQYPVGSRPDTWEYYVVYMVNKKEYEECVINERSKVKYLLNCSNPINDPPFLYTLLIMGFQPIPGNPDFASGKSYYFITTSNGGRSEMNNQYKGVCQSKNMKMMVNVCCGDSNQGTNNQNTGSNQGSSNQNPGSGNTVTPKPIDNDNKPSSTRYPTTTQSTTSTSGRTTTSVRTTQKLLYPKTDSDKHPSDNLIDENVIHANGPKNVGLISDNDSSSVAFSYSLLLVTVTATLALFLCR
ncbi:ephrin-B2 isoform X2 [Patella vulgata]|uniref:ephrin-B2 isoform X2 n=1 Tax=Patella vulgata TaxID=6465 RepID=UPI00217F6AB7|nr:ephrin-B2 isoform X2 [Patella vulgata]